MQRPNLNFFRNRQVLNGRQTQKLSRTNGFAVETCTAKPCDANNRAPGVGADGALDCSSARMRSETVAGSATAWPASWHAAAQADTAMEATMRS